MTSKNFSRQMNTIKLELEVTPRELHLLVGCMMRFRDANRESPGYTETSWTEAVLTEFIDLLTPRPEPDVTVLNPGHIIELL